MVPSRRRAKDCLMKKLIILGMLVVPTAAFGQQGVSEEAAGRFFETSVRPVLASRCYQCHGPEMQKGSYASIPWQPSWPAVRPRNSGWQTRPKPSCPGNPP